MELNSEEDIVKAIQEDGWMMDILKAAEAAGLPDWWICAGFVRSKIWDVLHDIRERTPLPDIDVIFFDKENTGEASEKEAEQLLGRLLPGVPWSVKNQARMAVRNGMPPYASSIDAVSKFPETATALAVTLDQGRLKLGAPWGVEDAVSGVVRPTSFFLENEEKREIYRQRIIKKKWHLCWSGLCIQQI
ncbi:nucleotidyltransferase family protein [Bacillus infantis]|uniref:nucleotidyltransferase family protein n=1 Tax=Bacillus infantis TaxID=324767 RepID=UPI001CD51369|nr:nucleotidyltransferase family protein [Bacillus infantis]MCA1034028.1 nucleotidyltransferase family protein [Bacillus infantis]